jgi:hypothetical protein
MNYEIKKLEELLWWAFISAVAFFLVAFTATNGDTNWRVWLVSAGIGTARIAAAILANGIKAIWPTGV